MDCAQRGCQPGRSCSSHPRAKFRVCLESKGTSNKQGLGACSRSCGHRQLASNHQAGVLTSKACIYLEIFSVQAAVWVTRRGGGEREGRRSKSQRETWPGAAPPGGLGWDTCIWGRQLAPKPYCAPCHPHASYLGHAESRVRPRTAWRHPMCQRRGISPLGCTGFSVSGHFS